MNEVTDREFALLVQSQERNWKRTEDALDRLDAHDTEMAVLRVKAEAADESFKTWTKATVGGIISLLLLSVGSLILARGGFG